MNVKLRQRLVGAIVLVSLAIIFIPMLLPGSGDLTGVIEGSNVPPEPDYRFSPPKPAPAAPAPAEMPVAPLTEVNPTVEAGSPASVVTPDIALQQVEPPQQVESPQQVEPPQQAKPSQQAALKPASPKPVMPSKPSVQPGERAWIVQVGSFAARANARALRDRLRKQGFASFVEAVKGSKGKVYRVRVGPELSRGRAEHLQKKLAKQAKLTGLVQAYP